MNFRFNILINKSRRFLNSLLLKRTSCIPNYVNILSFNDLLLYKSDISN
jgi:hypothetical protein